MTTSCTTSVSFLLLAVTLSTSLIRWADAADIFSVSGNKIMKNGEWIVFNGISLECTEYFLRTNLGPLWGLQHCFGGPSHMVNGQYWALELNDEPANVARMLTGSRFARTDTITKAAFAAPYAQVIESNRSGARHPLIRLPTTGSTYLYDADCWTGNASDYANTLDMLIENFTAQGIAVAYDLHWNCPQPSTLGCAVEGPATFALREFGAGNPGALKYWDVVSKKYASNPYVFYELYNEPHFKPGAANFEIYYGGDSEWVGVLEMYNVIRANDPHGLIIMSGMQQYAFDAQTQLAFWLRYAADNGGVYPSNVVFNYHPYQGQGQGPEKSIQGALRMLLAGQQLAPVIFTEFGQACCAAQAVACANGATGPCNNHPLGDAFSYNLVNMAYQYDVSWTAWAWMGTTPYNCDNLRSCFNLRNEDGSDVANGTWGGAPWQLIWREFVANAMPVVQDTQTDPTSVNLPSNVEEQPGYLPRPCIMGDYNLGASCGCALGTNLTNLNYTVFADDSIYQSILPGMPPWNTCTSQGCPSHPCGKSAICQ